LLEYQREDGGEWVRFRNRRGIEVRGQCVCGEGGVVVEMGAWGREMGIDSIILQGIS
jgi:hypothetical protein